MKARPSKPNASPTREDVLDAETAGGGAPVRAPTRHRITRAMFAAELARVLSRHVGVLRRSKLPARELLEDTLVACLDNPSLVASLSVAFDLLDGPLDDDSVVRGNLAKMPLAELLQFCHLRRQTGILRVTSGKRLAVLALRDGAVDLVFASGTGEAHLLGRLLRREGLLDEAELRRALDASAGVVPLGEYVVANDLVTEPNLRRVLSLQSAEILFATLGWTEGTFVLAEESPWPEAKRAALGLGLGELVLEGCRRLDETSRLRGALELDRALSLDAANLATHRSKLGPVELSVVESVDGKTSVERLVRENLHSELAVLGAIQRLIKAKVARYAD